MSNSLKVRLNFQFLKAFNSVFRIIPRREVFGILLIMLISQKAELKIERRGEINGGAFKT